MKCVDENVGKMDGDNGDGSRGENDSNARIRQLMQEEERGYNSIKQMLSAQVTQISQKMQYTSVPHQASQ